MTEEAVASYFRKHINLYSDKCERLQKTINDIRADIEREADYQDAYVNADVAKGLYMALEIIDKYKAEEGN